MAHFVFICVLRYMQDAGKLLTKLMLNSTLIHLLAVIVTTTCSFLFYLSLCNKVATPVAFGCTAEP